MTDDQKPWAVMTDIEKLEAEVEAWRGYVATLLNRLSVYGPDHKRCHECYWELADALDSFDSERGRATGYVYWETYAKAPKP